MGESWWIGGDVGCVGIPKVQGAVLQMSSDGFNSSFAKCEFPDVGGGLWTTSPPVVGEGKRWWSLKE